MQRKELREKLNQYLKIETIDDYCPNGLQVEGKESINKVGTAVSASLETIEKGIDLGVDALIVHHGLFWKGDSYVIERAKKRKLERLLEHGISLFAYHLPLDRHVEVGNNWLAARQMGWRDMAPFTDLGVMGTFESIEIAHFVERVEKYYNHQAHTSLGGKKSVSSCALISGGAYRELARAIEAGVDCFITGNFDEPAWAMAHEERIHFLALGHTATERVGVRALVSLLHNYGLEAEFIDSENPF